MYHPSLLSFAFLIASQCRSNYIVFTLKGYAVKTVGLSGDHANK